MSLYMISYDQHRDKDYTPIWNQLRQWGAKRILESVWFAELNGTAAAVRDTLKTASRNEDSLIVVELKSGSGWAASGAQEEGVTWLRQHILK